MLLVRAIVVLQLLSPLLQDLFTNTCKKYELFDFGFVKVFELLDVTIIFLMLFVVPIYFFAAQGVTPPSHGEEGG
jgi:hypothetical protein